MKKHKKHSQLTPLNLGQFGRNEWAILGTTCSDIFDLVQRMTPYLSNEKMAYLDALHGDKKEALSPFLSYVDHNGQQRITSSKKKNKWHLRPHFSESNLLIINGNHFEGMFQIVVIDSKKKASLLKNVSKLKAVRLVLLKDNIQPYDFLPKAIKEVPVLAFSDTERIAAFLKAQFTIPELYGLVLMGGKSVRMGRDKSQINYHGKTQQEHTAELLNEFAERTFLSCRAEQINNIKSNFNLLPDTFTGLGPFGGILSALQKNPNKAWLVMAVDLPKMDLATLQTLVEARDPKKVATAFYNEETQFAEPLITIWEPASYPILLSFLAQGNSCPRKVLINSDIKLVALPNQNNLLNANTPEDFRKVIDNNVLKSFLRSR